MRKRTGGGVKIRKGWIEVEGMREKNRRGGQGQMRGVRVWTVVGFGEF